MPYEFVSDLNVKLALHICMRGTQLLNILCVTSPTECDANYGMAPPVIITASGFAMLRAPEWTSSVGVS
jgi:hypothetical protein